MHVLVGILGGGTAAGPWASPGQRSSGWKVTWGLLVFIRLVGVLALSRSLSHGCSTIYLLPLSFLVDHVCLFPSPTSQ